MCGYFVLEFGLLCSLFFLLEAECQLPCTSLLEHVYASCYTDWSMILHCSRVLSVSYNYLVVQKHNQKVIRKLNRQHVTHHDS